MQEDANSQQSECSLLRMEHSARMSLAMIQTGPKRPFGGLRKCLQNTVMVWPAGRGNATIVVCKGEHPDSTSTTAL